MYNFYTQVTLGHALGITKNPPESKRTLKKNSIHFVPRDYTKEADDYDKRIRQTFILPIMEGYLLYNEGMSEYKTIIWAMPNDPKDLPRGLHPVIREALEYIILRIQQKQITEDLYWKGIRSRDEILKKLVSLEFSSLTKEYLGAMVDDSIKMLQKGNQMTGSKEDKK